MSEDDIPDEIRRFDSADEYARLLEWLDGRGDCEEVPVSMPSSDNAFPERWYRHQPSGEVWRLVEPDFPYRGFWKKVRSG